MNPSPSVSERWLVGTSASGARQTCFRMRRRTSQYFEEQQSPPRDERTGSRNLPTHDGRLCVDLDVQRAMLGSPSAKVTKFESSLSSLARKIQPPGRHPKPRTYDPIPVPTHFPTAHPLSSFSRLRSARKVFVLPSGTIPACHNTLEYTCASQTIVKSDHNCSANSRPRPRDSAARKCRHLLLNPAHRTTEC